MPFYFSVNIKYVGLYFLKNDGFVSLVMLLSLSVSFLLRIFFGNILRRLKFYNTSVLMGVCSIIGNLVVLGVSFGSSRALFTIFSFLQFSVASMAFNLNYVSCHQIFSKDVALHLLKVFDL